MTDPNLNLSILLGVEGVYLLISSFNDDDNINDGERYIYNFEYKNLARELTSF